MNGKRALPACFECRNGVRKDYKQVVPLFSYCGVDVVNPELGVLQKVELRDAWKSEASDFTPWLARRENVQLLGEAIGLDLEVEAEERAVGPFRADILAVDRNTDSWVLIENELERTDHSHLGQLITYAAGLNAVTIVWIAGRFTEEHRAALDWLNEITQSDCNFFGLEIELWRIADSPPAPKFNVVSKPNEWSRSVSSTSRQISEPTETKATQLKFWTELCSKLADRDPRIRATRPKPQTWQTFLLGLSAVTLEASANQRDGRMELVLRLGGPRAGDYFQTLDAQKREIEAKFGSPLEWDEQPDNQRCTIRIASRDDFDLWDEGEWDGYHEWLTEHLIKAYAIIKPLVERLRGDTQPE